MKSSTWVAFAATVSLGAAALPANGQGAVGSPAAAAAVLAAKPTPRTADGKPDLSGIWNGVLVARPTAGGASAANGKSNELISQVLPSRDGKIENFEFDNRLLNKAGDNIPQYKPGFWDEINTHQNNTLKEDTTYLCLPAGVPRMGAPTKIIQTPKEFVFVNTGALSPNEFRMIPITGPKHDPERLIDAKYNGDGVAYWVGDTLVVDSLAFTEDTWLAGATGWIHSGDMHVVEKLTRRGDTLLYEVIVEDPEYLTQPWKPAPRTLYLNSDPKADLEEAPPCSERDVSHMTFDLH
jgi:hypothetical protein